MQHENYIIVTKEFSRILYSLEYSIYITEKKLSYYAQLISNVEQYTETTVV